MDQHKSRKGVEAVRGFREVGFAENNNSLDNSNVVISSGQHGRQATIFSSHSEDTERVFGSTAVCILMFLLLCEIFGVVLFLILDCINV